VEQASRGLRAHDGDWDPEPLNPCRKVALQPMRHPLGKRRDDHLVEVLMNEHPFDRQRRVGISHKTRHSLAGCLFEKGDRELERLSRLLSERGFPGEPGDQQP
jgi:hypothetical protein